MAAAWLRTRGPPGPAGPGKVKQTSRTRADARGLLGRWHYILNGDGVEELYDYLNDPQELKT